MPETSVVMSAEWRHVVLMSFEVPRTVLHPWVPRGAELDLWNDRSFVSVVGFVSQHTRVWGWTVPGHHTFAGVNLRTYVRRRGPEGWRHGVVFIRQLMPLPILALVARLVYGGRPRALSMWSQYLPGTRTSDSSDTLEYAWRFRGRWNHLWVRARGPLAVPAPESLEAFIAHRPWGQAARPGGCLEYQVAHPAWRVQSAVDASLDCDVARLFGAGFAELLTRAPSSVIVAEGSPIALHQPGFIPSASGRSSSNGH
ncbi:MAG: hypothetical protein COV75_05535 [Candidatus Omnitrophica bacterium CG11_big_fil_rev_8_21_14_0_20_63_9]|nr:MAG: hypothetical protein COV75_05535 [Candidatus Omnitrophica bacterium CG11_big_fil_rev_8_21_14_0_20_63_9]